CEGVRRSTRRVFSQKFAATARCAAGTRAASLASRTGGPSSSWGSSSPTALCSRSEWVGSRLFSAGAGHLYGLQQGTRCWASKCCSLPRTFVRGEMLLSARRRVPRSRLYSRPRSEQAFVQRGARRAAEVLQL